MMNNKENKIWQPLMLVGYVVMLLIFLSFFKLPTGMLNGHQTIDILADIRKTKPKPPSVVITPKDTTAFSKNLPIPMDSTLIADYGYDSSCSLGYFYQKLDSAKLAGRKVRIAYFGDSFIEGDEVTDEIRLQLQNLFGGNGIGFVPMQSSVAGIYTQLKLTSSGWIDYNFRDNTYKFPLGLSGHLFYPYGSCEVEYIPKTPHLPTNLKIYTGKPGKNAAIQTIINGKSQTVNISSENQINETSLSKTSPINSVKITTTNEDIPFYGVSMDGDNGVYLDNYSFRGNTCLLTLQVPKDVMVGLNKYLKYDLVVIHYGINAVDHNNYDYDWFETGMNKLIGNIRKGLGNVPILLVSTSDMAYKTDGKYSTEKGVPIMVARQKEIAQNNKVAFWNLYESMGGEGTMVDWVEGDSVLANKDYTHVNSRGAKKVGDLFFNKLIASKNYYQQTRHR